jgi:hypothetical protein
MKLVLQMVIRKKLDEVLIYVAHTLYTFLAYMPFLNLLTTVNESNFVPNAPLLLGRFPDIISMYLKPSMEHR